MKQNISRLALSAIALLAVSCNDSFMDRQPQTEIGVSSYFNTEEDLKMYCYNLYDFPNFNNYTADAGTDNQATTDVVEVKNIMLSANPTSMTVNACARSTCFSKTAKEPPSRTTCWLTTKVSPVSSVPVSIWTK